jgi:hypothetical protein
VSGGRLCFDGIVQPTKDIMKTEDRVTKLGKSVEKLLEMLSNDLVLARLSNSANMVLGFVHRFDSQDML